jgi:hypothetical protein
MSSKNKVVFSRSFDSLPMMFGRLEILMVRLLVVQQGNVDLAKR